ncbi:MAG TPA: PEP-CTERM sorting domain-containing protein [Phycisphaerae bacterium]|nr:PEP-CTERM sorting domain-containing protein [Phycisphaerae bacterium]
MKHTLLAVFAIIAAISLVGFASPAGAAVLSQYTFTGLVSTDDAPYAASTVDANATAGGFTPAAGLGSNGNWNSTPNGINTSGGNPAPEFAQKPISSTSQSASYSNNAYWSITLTPNSGYKANLTSLTFDLAVMNSGLAPSYYLSSSVGGFDTPIGAVANSVTGGYNTKTFDLSDSSFQNLTGTVEFRLYLWSVNGSGSSGSRWTFDNVTINGTIIPEPMTLSMLAAGGALMMLKRRHSA